MRQGYVFEKWGERIRHHRGRRSQSWLARILNVNQSTISAWERGVTPPSDGDKIELAEAFGIAVETLFPWSDVTPVRTPKAVVIPKERTMPVPMMIPASRTEPREP